MIPRDCKRLAEVDFPIAAVSKHAAREKSIRHGHPSTLHLWWARRPLASSRAVLMALLLPDPCDPNCPAEFKEKARAAIAKVGPRERPRDRTLLEHTQEVSETAANVAIGGAPSAGVAAGIADDTAEVERERRKHHQDATPADESLCDGLLRFIADFANWDNSADAAYLAAARGLVRAAHGEEAPLVVDPFAGGGSIPLEALRVGCDFVASDVNPVAVLIERTMLFDLPALGANARVRLASVCADIETRLRHAMTDYYGKRNEIAYIWTRTVRCESPNCGAEIPLLRSLWLSRRKGNFHAIRAQVKRSGPPEILLEVITPKSEADIGPGFVGKGKATCPACLTVVPSDRVTAQLAELRGGADPVFGQGGRRERGARLVAVVLAPKEGGGEKKSFRDPNDADYGHVRKAQQRASERLAERTSSGLSWIPDEPMVTFTGRPFRPGEPYSRHLNVLLYGMTHWSNLFSSRQKLALSFLAEEISTISDTEIRHALAMALGRCADYWTSLAVWAQEGEFVAHTFGRHALPIVWDYAEAAPWAGGSGSFESAGDWVGRVAALLPASTGLGQAFQADAADYPMPSESTHVWFTDPPYYDAIGYSDLADFFLVWHKRALHGESFLSDPFDRANKLSPRRPEIIESVSFVRGAPKDKAKQMGLAVKDRADFEEGMRKALAEGRRVLTESGVGGVVFAHKTTEGWEALLSAIVSARWVITASWPVATERRGRLHSKESASLSTSIHLVLRPRQDRAEVGDWLNVARELPLKVRAWMDRLSAEGIRGADLVFACIGPAMEVYSRYSKVVDAEDREILLGGDPTAKDPHEKGYLAFVWEVVGRLALERVLGAAGAGSGLEEDARLTALFLWTLEASASGNGSGAAAEADATEAADEEDSPDDEDEGGGKSPKKKGASLPFDVVRRFAQPLGIHLDAWENRIIETEKGVVRLLPVSERAMQLFGKGGVEEAAEEIDPDRPSGVQLTLFPDEPPPAAKPAKGRKGKGKTRTRVVAAGDGEAAAEAARQAATTLDRVHAAMLLQAGGQTAALRALLAEEKRRSPDFERLANALAALYPRGSEERRLVEAMLLAMPR